jgi:hypothetical protein
LVFAGSATAVAVAAASTGLAGFAARRFVAVDPGFGLAAGGDVLRAALTREGDLAVAMDAPETM